MSVISYKCWPEYFAAIASGKKKYDLRLNDREVHEGDVLRLEEWDPKTKQYTGRVLEKRVTYVRPFKVNELHWSIEEIQEKGLLLISLE